MPDSPDPLPALARLVAIMARLRGPDGCPWDRAQDFGTIAPYTIEEAYEVADAIARQAWEELKDELGDLLLQVVFHARMAEEAGLFSLADVAQAISDKLVRRHPHVFGDARAASPAEVAARWEAIKAAEASRGSVLDGVPIALPALMRADKLGRRASSSGFDWRDAAGAEAKVREELAELRAAGDGPAAHEEGGDLLFAVANLLRRRGIDPEAALRDACSKFERRFRAIETVPGFRDLPLEAKEALWAAAKGKGAP
ncbi:nucleoside triphosphate pyrophosphohydrolase [Thermaurantiacus sp.]